MKEKKMVYIRRNMRTLALVRDCSSLWDTGKGLIGSPEPGLQGNVYEGLLLRIPSYRRRFSGLINSVHMIGMRFPISVFWIRGNKVVDKTYAQPGFHIYSPSHPCSEVLELPAEALDAIRIGDILAFEQAALHDRITA